MSFHLQVNPILTRIDFSKVHPLAYGHHLKFIHEQQQEMERFR